MHDCQRFCEDLTDCVLAGRDPAADKALAEELFSCESCTNFYRDAKSILNIIDSAAPQPPELPDSYWQEFTGRLQSDLQQQRRFFQLNMVWPLLAVAASLLVILALAAYRAPAPREITTVGDARGDAVQAADDVARDLDPVTVDYLGQSE